MLLKQFKGWLALLSLIPSIHMPSFTSLSDPDVSSWSVVLVEVFVSPSVPFLHGTRNLQSVQFFFPRGTTWHHPRRPVDLVRVFNSPALSCLVGPLTSFADFGVPSHVAIHLCRASQRQVWCCWWIQTRCISHHSLPPWRWGAYVSCTSCPPSTTAGLRAPGEDVPHYVGLL